MFNKWHAEYSLTNTQACSSEEDCLLQTGIIQQGLIKWDNFLKYLLEYLLNIQLN